MKKHEIQRQKMNSIEMQSKKAKIGTQRFDPKKDKWVEKIHELYAILYKKMETNTGL